MPVAKLRQGVSDHYSPTIFRFNFRSTIQSTKCAVLLDFGGVRRSPRVCKSLKNLRVQDCHGRGSRVRAPSSPPYKPNRMWVLWELKTGKSKILRAKKGKSISPRVPHRGVRMAPRSVRGSQVDHPHVREPVSMSCGFNVYGPSRGICSSGLSMRAGESEVAASCFDASAINCFRVSRVCMISSLRWLAITILAVSLWRAPLNPALGSAGMIG